ncbi:ATP-binding protein [Anaerolineales bacterium HSG24]|nr:ATP-binding protein [Anaerolineales bacterium HSG24]
MYNSLKNISLFSELSDINLQQLLQITTEIHLLKDKNLFRQGSSGNYAYVIKEGEIEIYVLSGDHKLPLAIRKKGEVIGEMSLLDKAPRMASARALSDCVLLSIHREQFDHLLNNDSSVARTILYNVVARWRDTEIVLKDREKTLLEQSTQLTNTYKQLKKAHGSLEHRVQERTAELAMANASLTKQIEVRKQAEKELQEYREHLEELVLHRTDELNRVNIKLQNLNEHLHNEVIQRTQAETELQRKNEELSKTLRNLKSAQDELILSEKMALLGQLVSSVAHEVNTPLGAIRASIGNISKALANFINELPELLQHLSPTEYALFLELIETIIQQNRERLSSRENRKLRSALHKKLTTLQVSNSSTIADKLVEIGVYKNIEPLLPLLTHDKTSVIIQVAYSLAIQKNNSQNIMIAVDKASKVVFALKSYARHDKTETLTKANLIGGIEVVLTLYHNQLKHGIEVVTNYDDIPPILCYPDELNQVWTNLIHNAMQAMYGQGTLKIEVKLLKLKQLDMTFDLVSGVKILDTDYIVVTISDSGTGISTKVKPYIFEPFYTTKPTGEGTGLGLDIVRKIIEKHQGKIDFDSRPGQTTFTVLLPILNED